MAQSALVLGGLLNESTTQLLTRGLGESSSSALSTITLDRSLGYRITGRLTNTWSIAYRILDQITGTRSLEYGVLQRVETFGTLTGAGKTWHGYQPAV